MWIGISIKLSLKNVVKQNIITFLCALNVYEIDNGYCVSVLTIIHYKWNTIITNIILLSLLVSTNYLKLPLQ